MSKVTIKFWDKKKKQYEGKEWLVIDDDGDIFDIHRGEDIFESLTDLYEPHFYKDGERIA